GSARVAVLPALRARWVGGARPRPPAPRRSPRRGLLRDARRAPPLGGHPPLLERASGAGPRPPLLARHERAHRLIAGALAARRRASRGRERAVAVAAGALAAAAERAPRRPRARARERRATDDRGRPARRPPPAGAVPPPHPGRPRGR